MVYISESLALALLETLTGLQRYDQLYSYVFFRVALPDDFVAELSEVELPTGWGRILPPKPLKSLETTGPTRSRGWLFASRRWLSRTATTTPSTPGIRRLSEWRRETLSLSPSMSASSPEG